MKTDRDISLYLDAVMKLGLYSSKSRLLFQTDMLFRGIDLKDKSVLDIGGGSGLYSFYAACRGAKYVVCLEPEDAGSSSKATDQFHKLNTLQKCTNVAHKSVTLQAYESEGDTFDVILLHNSINHLDEAACMNLQRDSKSKAVYQKIFAKLYSLCNRNATLIICDCSRYNIFALLNIRNPIVPTIEWHKHQAPELWARLLHEAGFKNPTVRWNSFNAFRNFGRVLIGTKLMAYFLTSHFRLTMERR